ncbi:MAG: peptidoglycan-binding protein LysM [Gammaproteobacteria bacterium]
MSLFGFVKNIGKSLFGKDAEAAENIQKHIEENNPGVKDLKVDFDDGIVTLCGECESATAMQKVILMAGNVKGVEDVRIGEMSITPPASIETTSEEISPAADQITEVASDAEVPQPTTAIEITEILEQENVEYYIIQSGDSLSKIAKNYYGDAMQYPRLFEANREVIEDPDLIYPGQKIRIPLD